MTDARPFIAHDFSPHSGCCVLCGIPEAGAPPECVPTTAEPDGEELFDEAEIRRAYARSAARALRPRPRCSHCQAGLVLSNSRCDMCGCVTILPDDEA